MDEILNFPRLVFALSLSRFGSRPRWVTSFAKDCDRWEKTSERTSELSKRLL